jgi:hypothetical protein
VVDYAAAKTLEWQAAEARWRESEAGQQDKS